MFKIGFHCGPGGNPTGIGSYMQQLDNDGKRFAIKSVDHYGFCFEAAELAINSGIDHLIIYRMTARGQNTGFEYDVPNYDMEPFDAAELHWQETKNQLPPEFDKEHVWVELINEPDKERAWWLGHFCLKAAQLANQDGYKLMVPGWSSGEPETEHWELMLPFLLYASQNDNVGISLHEYWYTIDPELNSQDDSLIGRFKRLLSVCQDRGIDHTKLKIAITEFGWTYDDTPGVANAMIDLEFAAKIYEQYPQVLGATIWYLGGGPSAGNIANKVQPMIAPVTQMALDWVPTSPPEITNFLQNPSFENGHHHPDGKPEHQIPNNYLYWEAPSTAGNPINGLTWGPVEVRVLHRSNLPDADVFILDGDHCSKMFSPHPWWASFRTLTFLPAGSYRFECKVYPDNVDHYLPDGTKVFSTDENACLVQLKLNGEIQVAWKSLWPGQYNTLGFDFEVGDGNVFEMGVGVRCPLVLAANGVFFDDWKLERIDVPPPPTEPLTDYLWRMAQGTRKISLNPDSALQRALVQQFKSPVGSEEWVTYADNEYAILLGEDLVTGRELVAAAKVPEWNNVFYIEGPGSPGSQNPLIDLVLEPPFNKAFKVTSSFNAPRNYGNGLHEGLDVMIPGQPPDSKEPVLNMYPGIVHRVIWGTGSYYNYVIIRHANNGSEFYTWHCHLDDIFVHPGDEIPAGHEIGEVGGTGGPWNEHDHINLQVPGYGLSGYVVSDVVDPRPYIKNVPQESIDLLGYMKGDGRVYRLRYVRSDGAIFEETTYTKSVQNKFYHVKNRQWEELWYDNAYIYRGRDTSQGDGLFYDLFDDGGDVRGHKWVKRYMKRGEFFDRNPLVIHKYKADCQVQNQGYFRSVIRVENIHQTKVFFTGYVGQDVLEMAFIDTQGVVIERYYYMRNYGLVGYEGSAGHSAILEDMSPGSGEEMEPLDCP